MASLAPLFFLALSLFFHVGIILPLLSGWLYSNTRVAPAPPPVSVRMAPPPRRAPPLPVAPQRARSGPAASSKRVARGRGGPVSPLQRRQALTAPASPRQVAAVPNLGADSYPTYPQGQGRGRGSAGPGDGTGPPQAPEGPAGGSQRESVLEVAHVTGLPRTIVVPSFLQKQEARNFVITFEVTVEADGSPKVRVFQGSGCTGLDQMLTAELQQMRWEPATRDGKAYSSSFHISVSGDFRKGCENFTLSQTPTSASQN